MSKLSYNGEQFDTRHPLFDVPCCRLSLLGLGGGGGGGIAASASSSAQAAKSGGTNEIQINNGPTNSGLSTSSTLFILGGVGLFLLLVIGILHGEK